ncbi:hypothetical protein CJ030_MR1G013768 [Morella rubra]|uniref:Uncharacterized protein n=1 Tax=Morella rubra TaxID=262757 RepID=A0A6A1WVY9_9ROSI|nr:hypothetical protein CJ030_MR1G013768 [Morella rubra]
MKRGREFPSVTSGQLHSMSPIPSPTLSAPSPRDHFDLDYTRHEDVRTVVETMMTARRTHRNRMHAYFKKFPSKEAALLKPHPDTTEEQWKELCDLFTSEAFMKRSEQNKKNRSKLTVNHAAGSRSFQRTRACMKNQESGNINPAELYKKNYTNKDGIWTSEGAREIYERMDAFQRKCDLEGKTYTEIEVYSEILGKKSGYVRGLGRAVKPPPSSTLTTQSSDLQHQLAKARDEIEAMRAAREKDLQEFAKKQAEMEATLRDHREEQRVEQERIRLEQEERMKREQERMRIEHEERIQLEQERMRKEQERLRAEISKELEKKMSSVMEKKMSDMSKRLFSQFGGSKRRYKPATGQRDPIYATTVQRSFALGHVIDSSSAAPHEPEVLDVEEQVKFSFRAGPSQLPLLAWLEDVQQRMMSAFEQAIAPLTYAYSVKLPIARAALPCLLIKMPTILSKIETYVA